MNRRLSLALLAVVALGFLAGCSAAGSLEMTPVNNTALAEHASQSTSGGDLSLGSIQRARAGDIIENGSGTILAARPPLDIDMPYEHGGRYYNLTSEVVGRVSGVATLVSVDYNATNPNGTTISFGALSAADRRQLEPLISGTPSRLRDGAEIDDLVVYTDAQREQSVLPDHADGYVTVRYRGQTYELEVRPLQDDELKRYRYEATRIAESARAYAKQLKNEYAFTLSNLNSSQRKIVRKAIADGYFADSTDDRAFASLVERFRRHEPVAGTDYSGSWVVRYEGQIYWAEMDYGGFADVGEESITPPSVTPH